MQNYSLLLILILTALLGATTHAATPGSVLAWGDNFAGQTNVPVAARSGVVAIAAGYGHTVALKTNGGVVAWGDNSEGQTNVPVTAQSGVMAIAAGRYHTVALKTNGGVVAWGSNYYGQTTVPVGAQSGVTAIAASGYHTLAMKSDGSVLVWGGNGLGQPPEGLSGVTAIAASYDHALALKSDGSVVTWLLHVCCGIPTGVCAQTVPAAALSGVTAIAAGGCHSAVLKNDGSVVAWGDNGYGQTTVPVAALSGVVGIAAGASHTVALKNDGSVVAWGDNSYGQTTVPVTAQSGVQAIAAGVSHTVALVIPVPVIVSQPTNQIVFTGSNAMFSVVASTTNPPLHFQWRFNGSDLPGATNDSLTITNVQPDDAGSYNVVITDAVGFIHSALANLSLRDPVAPTVATLAADAVSYGSATLRGTVNPNGAASTAYFQYGLSAGYGSQTPFMNIAAGGNSISVSNLLTGLTPATTYHYRLVAGNSGGTNYGADMSFTTVAGLLAVDTFDYPPGSANGLDGGDGFNGPYSGGGNITAGSLGYTDTNGAGMPVVGNRFTSALSSVIFRTLRTNDQPLGIIDANGKFGADGTVIYIGFLARLETGTSASYGGLSLFNDGSEPLFIGDPGFSTFFNWGLDLGGDVRASTIPVTNTTRLLVARIDFAAGGATIRLYIDPPLAGEPTVPSVGPVFKGPSFRFNRIRFASGSAGTHSFDELRMGVTYADVVKRPSVVITQQPANQFVFVGLNAIFSVSATTTNPPLRYQWRFNGTNIAGATNDGLTISNAQLANLGNYNVLVSDTFSSVSSASASLDLFTPPYITTQPNNLAVRASSNATFTVTVFGPPPLFYQWQFNGVNLANETNATLLITNVQTPQFGTYGVVITNNYGALTSSVAILQLLQAPTIIQQPEPLTVVMGENATFTVTVTNNATLPIACRWIRNGVPFLTNVFNSTTGSLTLSNVTSANAGLYRVSVTNVATSVSGISHPQVALTVIPATAPTVLTLAATNVSATSAMLTGSVNPLGATTLARFEYGLTASYGSSTPTLVVGNATNSISVSNLVTGLSPGTTYHFRVVASNSGGTNFGVDQTFTTSSSQSAPAIFAFAKQGAQFSLSVATVSGATYHLERKTSLSESNWTSVANAPGNGLVQSLADLFATNSQSFYRVRIE